jgi:hypothetical protein
MNLILALFCILSLVSNIYVYIFIPKQKGKPGFRGDDGESGDNGPDGLIGKTGIYGEVGNDGPKGSDLGVVGDIGEKGFKGRNGSNGKQGIQGITGDKGPNGVVGIKGKKGEKGMPGNLGYEGFPVTVKGFEYLGLPFTCKWSDNLKCPDNKVMFDVSGTLEDDKIKLEKAYCCNIDIVEKGSLLSELLLPKYNTDVSDYIKYLMETNP